MSQLRVNRQGFISPRLGISGLNLSCTSHSFRFPVVSSRTTEAPEMLSGLGTLQLQNITGRDTSCLSEGLHLSVSTRLQHDCWGQVTVPSRVWPFLAWINSCNKWGEVMSHDWYVDVAASRREGGCAIRSQESWYSCLSCAWYSVCCPYVKQKTDWQSNSD